MTIPWTTLAYTPLLDPLALDRVWWFLLAPMALGIAVAYKAVRLPSMDNYWREVVVMTLQITLGMVALGAVSFVFIEWLVPLLVPLTSTG